MEKYRRRLAALFKGFLGFRRYHEFAERQCGHFPFARLVKRRPRPCAKSDDFAIVAVDDSPAPVADEKKIPARDWFNFVTLVVARPKVLRARSGATQAYP